VAAVEQLTDLLVTIGRKTHGINVYTLQQGDAESVEVPGRVAKRLQRWAKANGVRLHMLIADRRQVVPRVTYRYRRGIASIADVDRLPEVSQAELRDRL
jgi:hypothetical protein